MKHIKSREEYKKMNESSDFDIKSEMELEDKLMKKIYQEGNSENIGSGYTDSNGHVIPVALVEKEEFEIKDGGTTMDGESYFNVVINMKPSISDNGEIYKAIELFICDDIEFELENLEDVLKYEFDISENEVIFLKNSLTEWILSNIEKLKTQFNEVLEGENLVG